MSAERVQASLAEGLSTAGGPSTNGHAKSRHTTSERTTSGRAASERTTSGRAASERTTSGRAASERTTDAGATRECTVLLLGGTGRTGGRVLRQLLARGVSVRAVVRSAERLPAGVADDDRLTVVEADLLSLEGADLARLVEGCDAAISCLGHTLTAQGMFGRPRDLVTEAVRRLCRAASEVKPERPLRLVLMSSVSVLRPGRRGANHEPAVREAHRGPVVRAMLALLRGLVPQARDNQSAADFLLEVVGADGRFMQWTAVRPDSLKEGDVSTYDVHDAPVTGLFRPRETRMANVAHFMCELVTDDSAWERWRGELPVIVDRAEA